MRVLASFAMRGRPQAVLVAVALAMLSVAPLQVPTINLLNAAISVVSAALSAAVIALVTLRRGHLEGLAIAGLAGLAGAVLAYFLFKNPAPVIAIVLLWWLPVFAVALVLRITRSLPLAVEAALTIGLLAIGVIYIQVADPVIAWREALEPFSQAMTEAGVLGEAERARIIEELARWMTGLIAALFFLQLVVPVVVARWWQAVLYNPGGFQQEFHGLRLHQALGYLAVLLGLGLAGLGGEGLLLDLGILLSAPLMLQGLAVAHGVSALRKAHPAWLVAMYFLFFFAMLQVWMLLTLVGLADLWFDFRARIKTPGDRLND